MEDHKNHHYLIMEYCPNGTLLNLLERRKRLHELEVQCLLKQLINVLKYFKKLNVIYRNLEP